MTDTIVYNRKKTFRWGKDLRLDLRIKMLLPPPTCPVFKRHFILIQPPTIVIRIMIIMGGGGGGGGGGRCVCVCVLGGGSLSLCSSINRIKWQSASEELKGGDGEWHASLGRLCAANKKCVSVCQSVRASGPICTPLSLSLSLFFSLPSLSLSPFICWALSTPPGHFQCRRLSAAAAAAAALSPSPHRGGNVLTLRTGPGAHHHLHHLHRLHRIPLCLFSGLFFFFFFVFFFFFPGVHTGFDSQHRSQFRLWIIIPPHRPEKVGFVRCKGLCVVFWRVCFNFDFIGDVCWVCLFFVVFLIIIIIILRRTCSHTSCRHRNKDKKEKEKKKTQNADVLRTKPAIQPQRWFRAVFSLARI